MQPRSLEFLELQEKLFNKSVHSQRRFVIFKDGVNKLINTNLKVLLLLKINVEKIDSDKVSCAKKTGKYARRKTVITKKLSNQVQDLKKIGIKLYSIN